MKVGMSEEHRRVSLVTAVESLKSASVIRDLDVLE
jgi:hypothetical protein